MKTNPVDALLSMQVVYRLVVTLVFAAFVIALSVTPGIGRSGDNVFAWLFASTSTPVQKILHIVSYAILSLLWSWTFASVASIKMRSVLALLLSLGLGVALEWYQTQVPGRFGTITDVLLNAIGAVIGLALAIVIL